MLYSCITRMATEGVKGILRRFWFGENENIGPINQLVNEFRRHVKQFLILIPYRIVTDGHLATA